MEGGEGMRGRGHCCGRGRECCRGRGGDIVKEWEWTL